ncbi:MAG: WD40 repeat domain-containing protein, partial [Thermoflexales bacterium]|nr:WD40 repeat domain-containing protein [Thermoflexales bacterium]
MRAGALRRLSVGTVLALVLTACGAAQESLLEPTRTPGAVVTRPAPAPSPTAALRSAATPRPQTARAIQPETLGQLKPIYEIAEPFVYHAYTVAEEVIGLFGAGTFELRDRQTLEVITRTNVGMPDPILWYALSLDASVGAILRPRGELELYDLRAGARRRAVNVPQPDPATQSDIALSADGQDLILLAGGALYRVATDRGIATALDQAVPKETASVLFSADASHLAAAQPEGDIVIYFPLSGREPITLSRALSETATHMAFNASGTRFSATDGEALVIWEIESKGARVLRRFDNLGAQVFTFLDGERYMAVVQGDEAYLYDLVEDEPVGTLQIGEGIPIASVLFDPDGERVYVVSATAIAGFRLSDQDLLKLELRPPLMRPVFVPRSDLLLTYGGLTPAPSVAVVDPFGGDVVGVLPYRSVVRRMSVGAAGRYFAVQTQEGEIVVRSLEDGRVRARIAAPEGQASRALLCLSSDDRRVVFF